jgi:hypothetical protein
LLDETGGENDSLIEIYIKADAKYIIEWKEISEKLEKGELKKTIEREL